MPPKRKLTPEEKKALKIFKKAEKKRLAAEKIRKTKIDELEREIKYGDLTLERHEKEWKAMLMKISCEKMRKDLDYAWHNFERLVDSKNFTISVLLDEIRDSEEQYLMNVRNHIENIDNFVQKFKNNLYALKYDFETEVDNLINTANIENDNITATFKDNEQFFKMMIAGLIAARRQFITNTMGDYISRLNEEGERFNDITAIMKTILQTKLEGVWTETENFLKNVEHQTKIKRQKYNSSNEADIQICALLSAQKSKIQTSQKQIKHLKQKYNDLLYMEMNKIQELLSERQFYADSFWKLKAQLAKEKMEDDKRLTLLSIESNNIIKYLQEIEKKGENILNFATICRKFETQFEKVLPFPILKPNISLDENIEHLEKEFDFELEDLRHFWQKVAQVDAVRYSIEEEMVCLRAQNSNLKKKIHNYCECFNCPPIIKAVEDERLKQDKSIVDANLEIKKYIPRVKKSD